jgi:hypothetical protein
MTNYINEQLKLVVAQPVVFESLQHLARFKIDIFAKIVRKLQSDARNPLFWHILQSDARNPLFWHSHSCKKRLEKLFCLSS